MNLLKTSLALQMALATVLGIFFGLFLGELCSLFSPWANAYIMILKITTIPYLICAIIHGVGQLSSSTAKQILKKGALFIAIAWTVNIFMIYFAAFLFPRAKGALQTGSIATVTPSINFAELLIPENIFYNLSNNIIPAIVIFSILIGIALMFIKEKQPLMHSLETAVQALTNVTSWISRIAPFGTFIIIAYQVGTIQLATIQQVSTYILLYILVLSFIIFWIFPRFTSMLTPLSSGKWLKELSPILLLAYTTNVVIVCLPFIINLIQKKAAELDPKDEKAQSQIQGTVSIVFNLPLGSLFIAIFIFFAAIFYNTPLSLVQQVQLFLTTFLTSLGAVGLGSWINSLTFLLDSLGVPFDGVNLYLITLPFTSGFQSMVSVMEISTLSLLITLACRKQIPLRFVPLLRGATFILLPLVLFSMVVKTLNPFPPIQNLKKSIREVELDSSVKVTFAQEPSPPLSGYQEDAFERILRTKTLRIGYHANVSPFCLFNTQKHLVGYDISFAYKLAEDLGCSIEFVPIVFSRLGKDLNEGVYDIGMSAISITEDRLTQLLFTDPYIEADIVFVVKSTERKNFSSLEELQERNDVRIAVLKGSSFVELAKSLFPEKEIVYLDNYDAFEQALPLDILLWEKEEAIAWILTHSHYSLFKPNISLGIDSLGYAMSSRSERLLSFLNSWLKLKKNEGFTQKQYNLWILGQTECEEEREPRWSIIRNVLHWID